MKFAFWWLRHRIHTPSFAIGRGRTIRCYKCGSTAPNTHIIYKENAK